MEKRLKAVENLGNEKRHLLLQKKELIELEFKKLKHETRKDSIDLKMDEKQQEIQETDSVLNLEKNEETEDMIVDNPENKENSASEAN